MDKLAKSWVVIPAFNEGEVIDSILKDVCRVFEGRVVVVDDCSSDNTYETASQFCDVVRHPINLGQGAALQTGIDFCLDQGAQAIVTFDADGQHSLEDAVKMLDLLDLNTPMAICGSRFLGVKSTNIPLKKVLVLKAATIFTRFITGVRVTDAHNGLRAINKKALSLIRIRQNRMAHATEIIQQIGKEKIKYIEYPTKILYSSYSMAKGQKITNIVNIILELVIGGISK
jgi:polyprenyl-phospho-N-acetylgalactosaminyl synthase